MRSGLRRIIGGLRDVDGWNLDDCAEEDLFNDSNLVGWRLVGIL